MKIYHFTLIFVLFSVIVMILADMKISQNEILAREKEMLDSYLDEAVNAAAWELRASGKVFDKETIDRAAASFFYSLYASCGMTDNDESKTTIIEYITKMIINLEDGYYILEYRDPDNTDENEAVFGYYICSEKKAYDEEHGVLFLNGGVSFEAYMEKYPLYSEKYNHYSISAAQIKERDIVYE